MTMRSLSRLLVRRNEFRTPLVLPRSAWTSVPPTGALVAEDDVRFLLTHHTSGDPGTVRDDIPAVLEYIRAFHTGVDKGWPDIAYNFLIDQWGRIWEGRAGSLAGPIRGDATNGSQGHAILACWIGSYAAAPPSAAAIDAMAYLWAWQSRLYGVNITPGAEVAFTSRGSSLWPLGVQVTTKTIAGHRDMSDTICPGDAGYAVVQNLQSLATARLATT